MATLRISSIRPTLQVPANLDKTQTQKFTSLWYKQTVASSFSLVQRHKPSFKTFTTISSSITTEQTANNPSAPQVETQSQDEKFDWYVHWYPLMPVCDLDKGAPHAKKVLSIDVVIWWDSNESAWKVFDDADWLHYLKGGLISGEGCSVFIMVGVLMAPVIASSSLRHLPTVLR